ncbi:protein of unknown function [Candidatus Nitrosocosmicus franklandus]|uniref:Uncharacterized protein n=1 Tax=Candidatus Nitrosocosmicus franklandianus TaxID=1798806 RepID=A0A484I5Y6_9ARCH|nr:protein of unknown function [Candidatus Nitrosocosmicus franklandus]
MRMRSSSRYLNLTLASNTTKKLLLNFIKNYDTKIGSNELKLTVLIVRRLKGLL